jgi:hypothetical protein
MILIVSESAFIPQRDGCALEERFCHFITLFFEVSTGFFGYFQVQSEQVWDLGSLFHDQTTYGRQKRYG